MTEERIRGFLGRWSERKAQARGGRLAPEEPREEAAKPAPSEPARGAPAAGATIEDIDRPLTDEEREAAKDLPDIATLTRESDFTVFMDAKVPEIVRRRALRALWRSDPVFANLDGLTDMEFDYSDGATVVEGLKTAYRVGAGFLDDLEETLEKADAALAATAKAEAEAGAGGDVPEFKDGGEGAGPGKQDRET